MNPLTDTQLYEIAGRAAGLYEYATGLDDAWQDEADQLTGTDVPALLAEVRRLRAQLDAVTGLCDAAEKQAARWEHPLPVPEWVAEVRRAVEHGANRPVSA